MVMSTQSSSKQKYIIIQNFDLSYSIIEISDQSWKPVAGPYLTKEEAQIDMVHVCEQE